MDVERIDISGTGGDATLTLSASVLDNLAGGDTTQVLVVDGDAGDTLDLTGDGWTQVDSVDVDGQSYAIYGSDSSDMQVAANSDLTVA
jgi:hypothetical protein